MFREEMRKAQLDTARAKGGAQEKEAKLADNVTNSPVLSPSYEAEWWLEPPKALVLEGLGPFAWYAREVVEKDAAERLASQVLATRGWTQLSSRALLNLGGVPHADGLLAEAFPPYLEQLVDALTGGLAHDHEARPNQALINRYGSRGGIAAHADGPLFFPRASILTLSGTAVLRFYKAEREGLREVGSVLLEPRSLFVFERELYTDLKHGILRCSSEDGREPVPPTAANLYYDTTPLATHVDRLPERISITLRRAAKVAAEDRSIDVEDEKRRRAARWRAAVDDNESNAPRYL